MQVPETQNNLARKACLPCRRSKRRCDKKLPHCDLCLRKLVVCSYPGSTRQFPPTPESSSPRDHEEIPTRALVAQPTSAQSTASAIYFTVPRIFHQARLELPRPDVPVPADVASLIGDAASIRNIGAVFFESIHTWMPIISRKVFFTQLLNPLARRQTEVSLLAICMLLCSTTPPGQNGERGAKTRLYHISKRFYLEVEAAGALSIHILQAAVLLAVYEVGHGIYPAAYLTVGACARYGNILEIDKLGLDVIGDGLTWPEVEERRRVWWAIVLLDRFMNIGNPGRRLATEDPIFDTYLPVDDTAWDEGTTKPGDAVNISTGFTLKMGIFSRVAQATYLLSQGLKSVSSTVNDQDWTAHADETGQLRRTLLALVHLADTEATVRQLEFCTASSLCFSTLLLLQDHYWQSSGYDFSDNGSEIAGAIAWDETITAVDRLSAAAASYQRDCQANPSLAERVSFTLIQVMYQVASVLIRLRQIQPSEKLDEGLETSRTLLQSINTRWQLAGVFLSILEAEEITVAAEGTSGLRREML